MKTQQKGKQKSKEEEELNPLKWMARRGKWVTRDELLSEDES